MPASVPLSRQRPASRVTRVFATKPMIEEGERAAPTHEVLFDARGRKFRVYTDGSIRYDTIRPHEDPR